MKAKREQVIEEKMPVIKLFSINYARDLICNLKTQENQSQYLSRQFYNFYFILYWIKCDLFQWNVLKWYEN